MVAAALDAVVSEISKRQMADAFSVLLRRHLPEFGDIMAAFSIKEGWDVCRELSRSREGGGVWGRGGVRECVRV